MSEDRIYLADLKAAGFCVKGSKETLEKTGIDFREFARHGIPVETIRALGFEAHLDHVLKIREAARG